MINYYIISSLLVPPFVIGLVTYLIAHKKWGDILFPILLYLSLSLSFLIFYGILNNSMTIVICGPYYSIYDKLTYSSDIFECIGGAMVFTPICICCFILLLGNKLSKILSVIFLLCYNMLWGMIGWIAQSF